MKHTKSVLMASNGRITLPAPVRKELGVEGETEFEVSVDTDRDAIVLIPIVRIPREDAWFYERAVQDDVQSALDDLASGRVYRASESDLKRLANGEDLDSVISTLQPARKNQSEI